jgi:hypothetical protein
MIEVARGRLSKQIARDIGIAKGTAPVRNCTAELEKASRFATLTPAGRGGRRVKSCHSDQSFQWGGQSCTGSASRALVLYRYCSCQGTKPGLTRASAGSDTLTKAPRRRGQRLLLVLSERNKSVRSQSLCRLPLRRGAHAITPAIRLIPGYQHIWNPVAAQVSMGTTHADIFLTRLTVAW